MATSNKRPRPVEFDEESDEELGSVKIPAVKEFAVRIFEVLARDNFTKQKFRGSDVGGRLLGPRKHLSPLD